MLTRADVSLLRSLILPSLIVLNVFNTAFSMDVECTHPWFDCGNGKCIGSVWLCDNDNDCGNMKDEENCANGVPPKSCLSSQFQCLSDHHCIPEQWHCDGEHDCDDQSDEMDCDNSTECNGFRCKDNHCIPERWKCDGLEDCLDGSDEELCPNAKVCSDKEFTCRSGSCLNRSRVCDGKKDCSDASDEGKHCSDRCVNLTCSQGCRNTPSGPECFCNAGYKLAKDNKTCTDVNECAVEGFCSHSCTNLPGSFKCSCMDGYELVNRTCQAKGSEPLLIFSTLQEIRGMYLRSGRYFLIQKAVSKAAAVDADPTDQKIYWAEISNKSTVYSSKIDGSDFSAILNHGLLIPEDIAVDYLARNLYITDSGLKQILTCKMDGTMCHVLHRTNTDKPRSLALDPSEGLMYWSDWGQNTSGIYRSGMDGSHRIALVSKDIKWPNGIAIDHTTNRLYWCDAHLHTIEYVSLDGKTRKILLKESVYRPYSLAVFEDQLYWTDWSTFSLDSCNKFTGHKMTLMTRENGKHIMGVHVYHPVLASKAVNPCWGNKCSHMCLIAPSQRFRCVCPPGFSLSKDDKTCILDNKGPSLFVSEDSRVFRIEPEAVGSSAVTELPIPHIELITKVAYDWKSKTIFISDMMGPVIYAINMSSLVRRELVKNHLMSPEDLAFDWMSDNLYWVDATKGTVEVISLMNSRITTLISNLTRPIALALSPATGIMFVSTIGGDPSVAMYDMDGKNPKVITQISGMPMSLAMHPSKNLLYWADPRSEIIASLDYLDQYSVPKMQKTEIGNVLSVAVSDNFVYWTDTKNRQLFMMKDNSTFVHRLSLPGVGKGLVARKVTYSPAPTTFQRFSELSPCINNGGCSHLCVTSPKGKSCLCPTGLELSNNNVTCIEKKCGKDEFRCMKSHLCIPLAFHCDGTKDCEDGSDESFCNESFIRCPGNDFRCKNGRCIIASWKCDRRDDCGDNSDEIDCPAPTSCAENQFSCGEGECIPLLWRCDGENDCVNGTDESTCHATTCDEEVQLRCDHGQCIPKSWACDGTSDCFDGTDERNCPTKPKACTDSEFRCKDGTCIDKSMVCDRSSDCQDGSDEDNCSRVSMSCEGNKFHCNDGKCIDAHEVCDGFKDCSNGEEEQNCPQHSRCTDLEFSCNSSKKCISNRWLCDGYNDCGDGSDEDSKNCLPRRTLPPLSITAAECKEFYCYMSRECLPWSRVCDGINDCEDMPDEGGLCSKSCTVNNGGCAQMCRKSPQGSVCSCFNGFSLMPDGKTCEDVDECKIPGSCSHFCNNTKGGFKCSCAEGYFLEHDHKKCKADGGQATLVYMLSDQIRGIDLDTLTHRVYVDGKNLYVRGMDFDSSDGVLYWSDWNQGTINSYSADSKRQDVVVRTSVKPELVKWDWIAKNIYFTNDVASILACSKDGKYCTTVIQSASRHINSFDISPNTGLMFWSVWAAVLNKDSGVIERAEMDGSHKMIIISDKLSRPKGLSVDHVLKMIYWTDVEFNILECSDFNGQRRRQIVLSDDMYHPYSLAIFEDRVFWADWGTDSIKRCDKFTGKECLQVHKGNAMAVVMMVVHKVKQPKGTNRCARSLCEQICLPSRSSFTCKCSDGYTYNNRSCVLQSTTVKPTTPKPRCPDNYCLQGATCVVVGGKFRCQCPFQFMGEKCEIQIHPTQSAYDYSWVVFVGFAVLIILLIALVAMMCKRNRAKISKVTENVAVKFRNPVFRKKSGRLVMDTDDGSACDELMLGNNGAYKQSGFGNPLFGKKPHVFTDPESHEGDFKRWSSYDSEDSAFISEGPTREGSQLCMDDGSMTSMKASDRIVQFFRKL